MRTEGNKKYYTREKEKKNPNRTQFFLLQTYASKLLIVSQVEALDAISLASLQGFHEFIAGDIGRQL